MTRPDAERDARRDLLERVREARSEARPTGGVVVSLEFLDEVAEELRRYSLLMQAVNESADDCDEKCDSHAHREDCKTHDPASWLIDARAENERIAGELKAARDVVHAYWHVAKLFDHTLTCNAAMGIAFMTLVPKPPPPDDVAGGTYEAWTLLMEALDSANETLPKIEPAIEACKRADAVYQALAAPPAAPEPTTITTEGG